MDAATSPSTKDLAEAVVAVDFEIALVLYAQRQSFTTKKQNGLSTNLVDATVLRREITGLSHTDSCRPLDASFVYTLVSPIVSIGQGQ